MVVAIDCLPTKPLDEPTDDVAKASATAHKEARVRHVHDVVIRPLPNPELHEKAFRSKMVPHTIDVLSARRPDVLRELAMRASDEDKVPRRELLHVLVEMT